jgi:hypothetical protein
MQRMNPIGRHRKADANCLADLLPPLPPIAGLELQVFVEDGPIDNTIVVGAINSLGQTFIETHPSKVSAWRKLGKEVPLIMSGPENSLMFVMLGWLATEYPSETWFKELDAKLRKQTKFNL